MLIRDIKKLLNNALKVKEKFEKTEEKIRVNHVKRRELGEKFDEHLMACERLRKDLPNPLDPDLLAKLDSEGVKEKYEEYKFHNSELKVYNEKIRLLKQEADNLVNKSNKAITKEISHGHDVLGKDFEQIFHSLNEMSKKSDALDKSASDSQYIINLLHEEIINTNKSNSK